MSYLLLALHIWCFSLQLRTAFNLLSLFYNYFLQKIRCTDDLALLNFSWRHVCLQIFVSYPMHNTVQPVTACPSVQCKLQMWCYKIAIKLRADKSSRLGHSVNHMIHKRISSNALFKNILNDSNHLDGVSVHLPLCSLLWIVQVVNLKKSLVRFLVCLQQITGSK